MYTEKVSPKNLIWQNVYIYIYITTLNHELSILTLNTNLNAFHLGVKYILYWFCEIATLLSNIHVESAVFWSPCWNGIGYDSQLKLLSIDFVTMNIIEVIWRQKNNPRQRWLKWMKMNNNRSWSACFSLDGIYARSDSLVSIGALPDSVEWIGAIETKKVRGNIVDLRCKCRGDCCTYNTI